MERCERITTITIQIDVFDEVIHDRKNSNKHNLEIAFCCFVAACVLHLFLPMAISLSINERRLLTTIAAVFFKGRTRISSRCRCNNKLRTTCSPLEWIIMDEEFLPRRDSNELWATSIPFSIRAGSGIKYVLHTNQRKNHPAMISIQ